MQSSSDKSQAKQNERTNGVEDSIMMTIDYLRARLLSERSISKAARERADELANRVTELEEQLKAVSRQRKRAEKAARDVYSYLDSLGISDISEVYETDSNEEESQCESNVDNGYTTKFGSSDVKGNEGSSGSEHESAPSTGRSLSWKGRKQSARLLEKKCLNSFIRSRTSLSEVNSSPRHRLGKSCRQNKRRELRSTVQESRHDSGKSNAQDSSAMDLLDLKKSPERFNETSFKKDEVSHSEAQAHECDASSSTHEHKCSGEMDIAIQHQAKLIKCYETQEKAQRDWEEKYGENNDSCEPGSHSDVTEDRDENKAAVSHPVEINASHDHGQKAETKTNSLGRKQLITHFNSFKLSPDAACSEKPNFSEMQPPRSSTPDFAFSVTNSNQSSGHAARHLLHAGHAEPSHSGSAVYNPQSPQNVSVSCALVPREEPARLGTVLDALQEAKLLIKRRMNCLPETGKPVGRSIEASAPANREVDWLKLPIGCPGLFRVPVDVEVQAPSHIRLLLNSEFPSELTGSSFNVRAAALQGHQYISSPMASRLTIPYGDPFVTSPVSVTEPDVSNREPNYDFHFHTNVSSSSNSNLLPHSSFPDFFPRMSSNQMNHSQLSGSEAGVPPSGYPSFQSYDFRPYMYR